ncbi:MAG TPA: hypothetical protein PKY59_13935 [Pyrinomonadaceae bacterium]|nr:hypothetical protein [Pyrinomonadaceae bacterium]
MKKILILLIVAMFLLSSCGGSSSSTNSANSNVSNNTNSNSANNQTTASSVDPTPIKMDHDAFEKTDAKTLEGYKGRTMIVEGAIMNSWTEDSILLFGNTFNNVQCNGSFSSYKDAIKKFQDYKGGWIYSDVKGTVKEILTSPKTTVVLENCTLLKMDK